jgi:hypothetical protein
VSIEQADLTAAYEGSWYFIAGTGEPLAEWVEGYEKLLAEAEIGKPTGWFQTTGALINDYAYPEGWVSTNPRCFQPGLACLLFPLDGLHVGRLAMFKIRLEDRWFDDVIDNMRR